jgi:CheY-like chemotaxis protein
MLRSARLNRPIVLVVEDEAIVCLDMVHWVATLGSVVLKARNAEEAIALLDEHPDIQLLITDIRMPGSMDGLRLAHYVRERWPPIKIIVVSGMIDTSQSALPKRSVFIPKPYRPQDLWAALSSLIPAPGPRPMASQAFLPF